MGSEMCIRDRASPSLNGMDYCLPIHVTAVLTLLSADHMYMSSARITGGRRIPPLQLSTCQPSASNGRSLGTCGASVLSPTTFFLIRPLILFRKSTVNTHGLRTHLYWRPPSPPQRTTDSSQPPRSRRPVHSRRIPGPRPSNCERTNCAGF